MGTVLRSTDVLSDPAVSAAGGIDRSLDRMFDSLSHPCRRRILLLVSEYNPRDEDAQTIRRGPSFDEIALLPRLMHDHRDELPHGWP